MELKELLGEAYKSDMSLDEINKALAGKTFINEGALENYVAKEEYEKLKKRADEASSEASDFKKKYRATLTDKEQLEVAQKEADSELQKKYEELLTKTKISEYKANYMAVGYDEKLANKKKWSYKNKFFHFLLLFNRFIQKLTRLPSCFITSIISQLSSFFPIFLFQNTINKFLSIFFRTERSYFIFF